MSDQFQVKLDPSSLTRSSTGSITGTLYLSLDTAPFPSREWSDFPVVILPWWLDALRDLEHVAILKFMDGPYFARVRRLDAETACLECVTDRARSTVSLSASVALDDLRLEVEVAAKSTLRVCYERGWASPDTARLEASLADFGRLP